MRLFSTKPSLGVLFMNTPDVIATIQRAAEDIASMLKQQQEEIEALHKSNDLLENRNEMLQSILDRTRNDRDSLSVALTEANRELKSLKLQCDTLEVSLANLNYTHTCTIEDLTHVRNTLQATTKERDEAQAELLRLREIILGIAVSVEPVVNPLPPEAANFTTQVQPEDKPVTDEQAADSPPAEVPYWERPENQSTRAPHWASQPRDDVGKFVEEKKPEEPSPETPLPPLKEAFGW
jgi:hypothetical protein